MRLACTKKLLEQLRQPLLAAAPETDPLFSWSANLITLERRKTLVVTNDATRFGFILYGLRAADFVAPEELILREMRAALLSYHINPAVVDRYFADAPGLQLTKTTDRRSLARLTKACERAELFAEEWLLDSVAQPDLNRMMNAEPVDLHAVGGLYLPHERLTKELEQRYGGPVFDYKAIDLTVELPLGKAAAWRRLIVPADATFEQLHMVIQKSFEWENSHLFEFELSSLKQGVIYIFMDEEGFDDVYDDETALWADEAVLDDYLNECRSFTYTYDLGDEWIHNIKVNRFIEHCDRPSPVCIMGEGDAPPEDIGGPDGYARFLEIQNDPNHPDHEDLEHWLSERLYSSFDIRKINTRLTYL